MDNGICLMRSHKRGAATKLPLQNGTMPPVHPGHPNINKPSWTDNVVSLIMKRPSAGVLTTRGSVHDAPSLSLALGKPASALYQFTWSMPPN